MSGWLLELSPLAMSCLPKLATFALRPTTRRLHVRVSFKANNLFVCVADLYFYLELVESILCIRQIQFKPLNLKFLISTHNGN